MKRFLSRETFYIYNSIGFASEGKIIVHIAMNLALVSDAVSSLAVF